MLALYLRNKFSNVGTKLRVLMESLCITLISDVFFKGVFFSSWCCDKTKLFNIIASLVFIL